MTTVAQLLGRNKSEVHIIRPEASVFDAVAKMAEKDVGSLLVMSGEDLIGIFTERHFARNVAPKVKTSLDLLVRDVMEKNVLVVYSGHTVEECMALMSEKRVRHLPVVDGDRVVGIVSIGDLVKSVIGDQNFIIKQLEHYIGGG